jgi:hypothetical protein
LENRKQEAANYPTRIYFALMQPINSTLPSIQLDARSARVLDILQNLQNAGLFRAVVVKQTGNQVLLDTAFGNITGKAPDQLKTGDEIMARITTIKPQPTLKIEQQISQLLTLPKAQFKSVVQNINSAVLAAKVVSHSNNQTLLNINNQVIPINRQDSLQIGETLLLKDTGTNQLQLIRIQPQAVLKAALSSLIPRSLQQGQQYNLSSLQKVASELVGLKGQALIDRANIKTTELTQPGRAVSESLQTITKPQRAGVPAPDRVKLLNDILSTLAKPLVSAENIKPQTLQQFFSYLALIKTEMPGNMSHLSQQLQNLSQVLKQSPESFSQLIRDIFSHSAHQVTAKQHHEAPVIELSNTLRLELLQQTEHTLNHLLTQQTSVRLQQEQHQPLSIFLNIPIQVDMESQNLQLKIKQKEKNQSDDTAQYWEIELSFEFGLLGMITTRILLQDTKISANFWAHQSNTKSLIDNHMDEFRSQLKKAGFELGLFDCFYGTAPEPDKNNNYTDNHNLLDLEA